MCKRGRRLAQVSEDLCGLIHSLQQAHEGLETPKNGMLTKPIHICLDSQTVAGKPGLIFRTTLPHSQHTGGPPQRPHPSYPPVSPRIANPRTRTMATKAQQKENLEKVTDYVEERVLDADRMAKAMSSLESDKSVARAEAAKQILYVRVCLSLYVCVTNCACLLPCGLNPCPCFVEAHIKSLVYASPPHPTVIEGHPALTHSSLPPFSPYLRSPSSITT